ncbi:MAG: ABC transporter permease [Gammaproteobacteria bacterium]|nr:ABC transporter permease [Gammaproteobacteria bacterium]
MMFHIALRELRSLFFSPLAWSILAVMQFILALIFLALIESFENHQAQLIAMNAPWGVTDLIVNDLFMYCRLIFIAICPLLTMHILSEERNSGSLNLLLSSPVSMTEIVLGKYLGILIFFFCLVLLIALMPLSLLMGTDLDLQKLSAGIISLLLLSAAFCSLGLYMSSLTRNQIIAAISSLGLLILFAIMNSNESFKYFSTLYHHTPMLKGIMNSSDIIYYVLFIIFFISLSIRQMDNQRLQS